MRAKPVWIDITLRAALRRLLAALTLLIGCALGAPLAHACFLFPTVSLGNGVTAAVCENIFPNFVPGGGGIVAWDYQYWVINTSGGGANIDLFAVGVGGVVPANGTVPNATTGLAGITAPVPNFSFIGLVPNALVPFLNGQANEPGWEFDYYATPGGYFIDWNDVGPGILPPAAALAVNGADSIAPGTGWWEFDLYSPYGPVFGSGYVDPLYFELQAGDILGISTPTNDSVDLTAAECLLSGGPTSTTVGDPSNNNNTDSFTGNACANPTSGTVDGGSDTLNTLNNPVSTPIPEPPSWLLLLAALVGLALLRRRAAA